MLKIKFKERLFIIFFALFLALYPPVVKYQEVQAMEWVGMEVSYTTALKFILGLLGITVANEVTDDWWEQTWNDCFDYTMEDQTQTTEQITEWWNDVKKGTLDTASSVWTSVKEWIQSKFSSTPITGTFGSVVENYFNIYNLSIPGGFTTSLNTNEVVCSVGYYYENNYYVWGFANPITKISKIGNSYILTTTYGRIEQCIIRDNYYSFNYRNDNTLSLFTTATSIVVWGVDNISNLDVFSSYSVLSGLSDNPFDSATDVPIPNIGLTTDNAVSTAIPDVIPLPWENVGADDTAVSDAYDDAIAQVNEGILTLEGFMEALQEMLGVIAIDTTNDDILPVRENPDTGENEDLDDLVNENTSNFAFTLSGLEKVFPFCIPWDIYSFVTLLVAEPVAPVINYPFYNPVTNEDIIITIDFSIWENVVVVFRYIFDFLLIIGLLLLARSLAGAGGDE